MPKVRKSKTTISENEFINSADSVETIVENLDPNAKRNYKNINVSFNKYEYDALEKAATEAGRTKLNFIRWAILKLSKK